MYYSLGFLPELSRELADSIEAIRKAYDPTEHFIPPHVTLIFPTHDRIGEKALINHIDNILSGWAPFNISLGGFHRSRDFWMLMGLREGEGEMKRLYMALHTGILDEGGDYSKYIPHLGLGLFLKEGCCYDWRNPKEEDFDEKRYVEALREAERLPLGENTRVDKFRLSSLSDEIIEWTTGKRLALPDNAELVPVREFRLGRHTD